jgi:hypothetical protein
MDELQVIVKTFMLVKPDKPEFPYSEHGQTLISFVRRVCAEHCYTDIESSLNLIVDECEMQ